MLSAVELYDRDNLLADCHLGQVLDLVSLSSVIQRQGNLHQSGIRSYRRHGRLGHCDALLNNFSMHAHHCSLGSLRTKEPLHQPQRLVCGN